MSEVKYRHPLDQTLSWTGKGRSPKWFDYALENGFSEADLLVENQPATATGDDIDLGIGESPKVLGDLSASETQAGISRLHDQLESGGGLPVSDMSDGGKSDTLSDLIVSPDFAGRISVDLTASVEARWTAAREHEELGKARFAALGLLLLSIKKDLPHGEFMLELERRGFEERQSRRAMAYANYVFTQPAQQQARLIEMPVTKVAALAGADPDVVEALMNDGDKVEKTTVRGLLDELKGFRNREQRLQDDLEIARLQLERLQGERKRLTDLLPRTEDVRAECLALQAGAEWHLNALRKLFDDTEEAAPEGFLQIETVWIAANAIAARALDLVQRIRDMGPENLPDRPHGEHCMTEAEAHAWLLNYPLIESRLDGEASLRKEKREAARPRGPGRPAGSKNKANGDV